MVVEFSRLLIAACLIQGVMAVEDGLTGLIVAGVIAASLMIIALIIVSVICYVRSRRVEDEKESLDIVAPNGVVPRYQRFPPTMKFRSYGPTSSRSRPAVTFFTVRSPRAPDPLMPVGAPFLYEPRGPVMFVSENGNDASKERPKKSMNGHVHGSMKIREVHSAEEWMDFEDEDENGNHRKSKLEESRSRSKSHDRKYTRNPDSKRKHRYHNGHTKTEHHSRSRSNSRNRSENRRNTPDSTIMAQPGDIILNPANYESQNQPKSHSLSRSTNNQPIFTPIAPALPQSERPSAHSAFTSYNRNSNVEPEEEIPLETPREDYLVPSITDMPSTIRDETPREPNYLTPMADYPKRSAFVYPPRQSATQVTETSRPATPEFDAQSIIYADNDFLRNNISVGKGDVYESTPRPVDIPDAPFPPAPPPPPPIPSTSSNYLSAVNRPPTPVPGLITPVDEDLSKYLDKPTISDSIMSPTAANLRTTSMGVSPQLNAVIAEMQQIRRQRHPSDNDSVGGPPSVPSNGFESESARVSPQPRSLENRRPSAVQFTQMEPEIIPREEPDIDDYSPRSLSEAFDSAIRAGSASASNSVPPAPPPPPPPPISP